MLTMELEMIDMNLILVQQYLTNEGSKEGGGKGCNQHRHGEIRQRHSVLSVIQTFKNIINKRNNFLLVLTNCLYIL